MKKLRSTKNNEYIEKDNKGSVMITVLVAFFFLSVLVAIVLSTVAVNFKMRSADRRSKDEFYYAEKALNDVYTGIGQKCSEITGEVYNKVMTDYKGVTSGSYKDEETAYEAFVEEFVKNFSRYVEGNSSNGVPGYEELLENIVVKDTNKKGSSDATSRAILKSAGTVTYYNDTSKTEKFTEISNDASKIHCIVIEGVRIQSNLDAEENAGYMSEINTDIVIEVPRVNFFNVNNKAYDYALVANAGIEFGENSRGLIKGNVYGGTLPFADNKYKDYTQSYEYGGIYLKNGADVSIEDSEYVVSGGDIYVDGAKLYIEAPYRDDETKEAGYVPKNNQVWFENIEVNGKSTIKINGDLYAADDLQVNSGADESLIKIKGSYYGYNNGDNSVTVEDGGHKYTLTTKKSKITNKSNYKKWKKQEDNSYNNIASVSSSIIMNSKKAEIDMTNLKTLMLLGNAFIDHESKTSIVPGNEIKKNLFQKVKSFSSEEQLNDYINASSENKAEYEKFGISLGVDDEYSKMENASVPESVALKASQDITLMPTEFIKVSNPKVCTAGVVDPFDITSSAVMDAMTQLVEEDGVKTYKTWFAKKYVDINNPYTVVKMKAYNGNHVYAYCYLNFKDDESKTAYVNDIVAGEDTGLEPTAATLKEAILGMTDLYDGKIKISAARTYGKNAILGFDGTNLTVAGNNAESTFFDYYSNSLYRRYRMLDTYLDPMRDYPMSEKETASNGTEKTFTGQDFKKKDNEMPLARFFWIWGLRKAGGNIIASSVEEAAKERKIYGSNFVFLTSPSDAGIDLCDALANVKDPITGKVNAFVIIDCTNGGAYIKDNLNVNGFIACNGKIKIADNKELKVTYDSQLLNKRIEKEKDVIAENGGYHDENMPSANTAIRNCLIYYLMNSNRKLYVNNTSYKMLKPSDDIQISHMAANQAKDDSIELSYREYKYDTSTSSMLQQRTVSDYSNFVYFENWKKGLKRE